MNGLRSSLLGCHKPNEQTEIPLITRSKVTVQLFYPIVYYFVSTLPVDIYLFLAGTMNKLIEMCDMGGTVEVKQIIIWLFARNNSRGYTVFIDKSSK